jgi:hypothetical protein
MAAPSGSRGRRQRRTPSRYLTTSRVCDPNSSKVGNALAGRAVSGRSKVYKVKHWGARTGRDTYRGYSAKIFFTSAAFATSFDNCTIILPARDSPQMREQRQASGRRRVSLRLYSALFLAIVALATAECAQIGGVLLVFALMVGPAAAAQRLTSGIGRGLLLSAVLALLEAWAGITLAFYTDWPSSFWISALSAGVYLFAAVWPAGWIRQAGVNSGSPFCSTS